MTKNEFQLEFSFSNTNIFSSWLKGFSKSGSYMKKVILHRIIKYYLIVKLYLGTFTDLIYIYFAKDRLKKDRLNIGYR